MYKILSNEQILPGKNLYDMRVIAPDLASECEAGQIAMLACGGKTTLRRPLSICDADAQNGIVRFCYEVRGEGTDLLSKMKSGDDIDIMSPLGHGFTFNGEDDVILIGGGIGIYPMLFAARRLGNAATVLLGFRNASLINLTEDFEAFGARVKTITDDGSSGKKGFVTELLKEELAERKPALIAVCGPRPMMKAVSKLAEEAGVPCLVSMEEHMACGVGACLGCVTACKELKDSSISLRRVCKDGPVFDSREIVWDAE